MQVGLAGDDVVVLLAGLPDRPQRSHPVLDRAARALDDLRHDPLGRDHAGSDVEAHPLRRRSVTQSQRCTINAGKHSDFGCGHKQGNSS